MGNIGNDFMSGDLQQASFQSFPNTLVVLQIPHTHSTANCVPSGKSLNCFPIVEPAPLLSLGLIYLTSAPAPPSCVKAIGYSSRSNPAKVGMPVRDASLFASARE